MSSKLKDRFIHYCYELPDDISLVPGGDLHHLMLDELYHFWIRAKLTGSTREAMDGRDEINDYMRSICGDVKI